MSREVETARAPLTDVLYVKIPQGASIVEALADSVRRHEVKSATIASSVGALGVAVFRNLKRRPSSFPVTRDDRVYMQEEEPTELLSIGGWIARTADGQVEVHAHFSASKGIAGTEGVETYGGHLTPATKAWIKLVVVLLIHDQLPVVVREDPHTKDSDIFFEV